MKGHIVQRSNMNIHRHLFSPIFLLEEDTVSRTSTSTPDSESLETTSFLWRVFLFESFSLTFLCWGISPFFFFSSDIVLANTSNRFLFYFNFFLSVIILRSGYTLDKTLHYMGNRNLSLYSISSFLTSCPLSRLQGESSILTALFSSDDFLRTLASTFFSPWTSWSSLWSFSVV